MVYKYLYYYKCITNLSVRARETRNNNSYNDIINVHPETRNNAKKLPCVLMSVCTYISCVQLDKHDEMI